jgi:hypothetical protein
MRVDVCLMRAAVMATLGVALAGGGVQAQAGGAKKPAATTVEIRGEVPTPQLVTVRPREVPEYSRGVLVPSLYDRHFWVAILAPYRIVPPLPTGTAHRPPGAAGDSVATSSATPVTAPPAAQTDTAAAKTAATPAAKPNAPKER